MGLWALEKMKLEITVGWLGGEERHTKNCRGFWAWQGIQSCRLPPLNVEAAEINWNSVISLAFIFHFNLWMHPQSQQTLPLANSFNRINFWSKKVNEETPGGKTQVMTISSKSQIQGCIVCDPRFPTQSHVLKSKSYSPASLEELLFLIVWWYLYKMWT